LTVDMVWKFSHQARHYILAYFYLEHEMEEKLNQNGLEEVKIENVKREFKTHQSAIDFVEAFINHIFHGCHDKQG